MGLRAGGFGGVTENTGAFKNDLYAEIAPGQISGAAFSKNLNGLAVKDEVAVYYFNFSVKFAIAGIIFEELGVGLGVPKIVDADYFEFIRVTFQDDLEKLTTDASKSVNAYFYCHCISPKIIKG